MGNGKNVKEEWNAIIAAKLKDGVTIDDLKHEYVEGILIEPNVLADDIQHYNHSVQVSHPWTNMAQIAGGNSIQKNALVMQVLQQGANGLSIKISKSDSILDILKDVLTGYLDVRIDCSKLTKEEVENQKSQINISDFPNIRWVGENGDCKQPFISEQNRVDSIKTCIENVDLNSNNDIVVSLGKNILFEIASLRAIRAILDEMNVQSFKILVQYEIEGTNELGDYNLIEKTYKILSGILGGTDAILTPYNGDEESRLTLNIQNVLDLESGMKNVLDPLGGSYYIEKLTGEIIRQVKN